MWSPKAQPDDRNRQVVGGGAVERLCDWRADPTAGTTWAPDGRQDAAALLARRKRQISRRFAGLGLLGSDAGMRFSEMRMFCQLDASGAALVRTAVERLGLSARATASSSARASIADGALRDHRKSVHVIKAIK